MPGTASLESVITQASMQPVALAGLGRQLQPEHLSVVETDVTQVEVPLQTGRDSPAAVHAMRSQCRQGSMHC
ncbi:hypothetical protein IA64_02295 [Xanthomonas arboricola pv. celebensis]|nr:hypothetical protein IA64_02295 [Xanthomonas arboricola pv. celebensis]